MMMGLALIITLFLAVLSSAADVSERLSGSRQKLLQKSNIEYLGAFRVPDGNYGCPNDTKCSFHYGGGPIAYNAVNNSLYVVGHRHNQWLAEINVPALVRSNNLGALNTATIRQNFTDLTHGKIGNLGVGGAYIENGGQLGGLLLTGNRLLASAYAYYDGSHQAYNTHFTANADWSKNGAEFSGMKRIGVPPAPQAGYISGYMSKIPGEWQAEFGGSAITGNSNLSIISRTSLGPAAFVFNPNEVDFTVDIAASPLVYYPPDHRTIGDFSTANPYANQTTKITGVVFPEGSRSVLFFGRHGLNCCYGTGTSDAALVGKPAVNGGSGYCYDPADDSKGTHGYPYVHQVWAYDATDMLLVKNGTKKPWDISPYSVWTYELPFQTGGRNILGAAYDPARQRIFISQDHGEGNLPVIHVLQVLL